MRLQVISTINNDLSVIVVRNQSANHEISTHFELATFTCQLCIIIIGFDFNDLKRVDLEKVALN